MGARTATSRYDRSVFLNCPFDDTYKPILDAIVFCIHDSGFVAEIALNDIGTGKTRPAKIVDMIGRCRYSIHDLSRIDEPRLNMAFECGICYGALTFGTGRHKRKDLFVLDAEEHRYKKTMSDIAGQDADVHHNDPVKAHRLRPQLSGAQVGGEALSGRNLHRAALPSIHRCPAGCGVRGQSDDRRTQVTQVPARSRQPDGHLAAEEPLMGSGGTTRPPSRDLPPPSSRRRTPSSSCPCRRADCRVRVLQVLGPTLSQAPAVPVSGA